MAKSDFPSTFFVRLNDGTASAAELVDERFRQKLCSLVERELNRRFASRLDPEDVVQPAFKSFFRGISEKGWRIESKEAMWGLLVKITRNKIRKVVEKQTAEKRELGREVSGEGYPHLSSEPSPEDVVLVADLMERVVADLSPPDPEIFRLRLEGNAMSRIARLTNVPESRVRTTLSRVRDRLRKLLSDTASE